MDPVEASPTQARIVELLSAPATYPHGVDDVAHVQTHISHVFLAGDFVYKLKKAVTFPFLDFSTAAARRAACEEEVRLNRRLAGDIYVGVVDVPSESDGRWSFVGGGPVVDAAPT